MNRNFDSSVRPIYKYVGDVKVQTFQSSNQNVEKHVFEFNGEKKAVAETVLYRYDSYQERTVICCSVQSGCPVGCVFCGTGKFFVRNLTWQEICYQVLKVTEKMETYNIKKFQIMFMSMGEPFLNCANVFKAIEELYYLFPNAQLLVSTSAPANIAAHFGEFVALSQRIDKVGLQFSVHESTDENRRKIIPTPTCTLRQIGTLGEMWAAFVHRKPFFNYCVHEGNSAAIDAKRLGLYFNPDVWESTLSVICEKNESVKASVERQLDIIKEFNETMAFCGFSTRVFNPAGQDDIGGGCGQLWYFQKWLNEHPEHRAKRNDKCL